MTDEKKPGLAGLQDQVIEMAKDLLMLDTGSVLEFLRIECPPGHRTDKEIAFEGLVAALHGARGMAEEFRRAHVAESRTDLRSEMDRQFQEELARIDSLSPEEIAARRAS